MDISVVVPAYNEETSISYVLNVLERCLWLKEVIVVADGCTDNTVTVARGFKKVRVIELSTNVGKAGAMYQGLLVARGDISCFIDADLIGLTEAHLKDLVWPIVGDTYDMTIGVFKNGRISTDLAQVLAPYLSGQRAIKRELAFRLLEGSTNTRYGVEVDMTVKAKKLNMNVKRVFLANMSHVMKEEKLGFMLGAKARIRMYWDIAKAIVNN